jgi:hypothetical protein
VKLKVDMGQHNFQGNFKAESCNPLVEALLHAYKIKGCEIPLNINFLGLIFAVSPTNFCAAVRMGNAFVKRYPRRRTTLEKMDPHYVG